MSLNHSGTISSPETWALADSPHIITDTLYIEDVVTIEAGCEVQVAADKYVRVRDGGKFYAVGTKDNLIVFKASATDWQGMEYPDSSSYTPLSTGYFEYCKFEDLEESGQYYIKSISGGNKYFEAKNCIFEGGGKATTAYGIWFHNGGGNVIDHCVFHQLGKGVRLSNGTATVKNSILQDCGYGLEEAGGTLTSQYNNFYNNSSDYVGSVSDKTGDELARDPEFVGGSPYDYHLEITSPCIGDGESGSDMGLEDYQSATEEIEDIDNDFRMLKNFAFDDITNDFRMQSNIIRSDINNDFRLSGANLEYINNDFRMKGNIVRTDIENDFRSRLEVISDIGNRFNTAKAEVSNINNYFGMVEEEVYEFWNDFRVVIAERKDINNDIRTKKIERNNINNDFRMIASWQIAGAAGRESLGKTYLKVYINDVEQTDVDIDSISWTETVNAPATARFILGRAFDTTKPTIKSIVKIKYNDILMYKGYITEITPGDKPESMQINCQDEMWNLDNTKKYFLVGHKPKDAKEYYFTTIKEALLDLGFNYDIGNFIPQTMDLYGQGKANCITQLVENSGNFGWFIKPDGSYNLWKGGSGGVVPLDYQELGTQLGLYQVLKQSFKDSIVGLVNRFRVLMGNWVVRTEASDGSGTKSYNWTKTRRRFIKVSAYPHWDGECQQIASENNSGFGYNYHDPNIPDSEYQRVFTHYYFYLSEADTIASHWDDTYPPRVSTGFYHPGNMYSQTRLSPGDASREKFQTEGFSIVYPEIYIDPVSHLRLYRYGQVIFSQPRYTIIKNKYGEAIAISGGYCKLYLVKEETETWTNTYADNPDDEPDEEGLAYTFYTDKLGTYSETITDILNLPNFSIQEGYTYFPKGATEPEVIPSWDDREFAEDYAYWQLSKICDVKTTGTIDLTFDAMLYYRLDLSRRIKINGVIDPINIQSITYNANNFTATVSLESNRYYKRSVSQPWHGE